MTECCCSRCAGVRVKHHLGPAGASQPNKRGENKKNKEGGGGERQGCQMDGVHTFKRFETGGFPTHTEQD